MVWLRTYLLCSKNWNNVIYGQAKRSFSFTPKVRTRGKWQGRRTEGLMPQIDGLVEETGPLTFSHLTKPFLFTVADNPLNQWWSTLTEGEKVFFPICLANIAVFLAWRVPSIQPTMMKYFCCNPGAKNRCWPMVLSTFSHYSAFHLFANMYVLHSFSTGAVRSMGKEQFVGFYMASGVISSFASYVFKVIVNKPTLSLGASGAIMGVLAYSCTKFPDLQLSIIFLPFLTFKAGLALKFIMGMDAVGVLLGWKVFDHAAHLGGALFGVFWSYWGSGHIWQGREPIVQAWHQIRTKQS